MISKKNEKNHIRKKILIVDDEIEYAQLLTNRIQSWGYDVVFTENADQALARIEVEPPDLILLDVCMPEMSGYQLYKKLEASQEFQSIPIIFITAKLPLKKIFEMEGIRDIFLKPLRLGELMNRVRAKIHKPIAV